MSVSPKILAATLLVAGVALLPGEAAAACTIRLTAFDASGFPVASADGYGAGADGVVLAPLSIATAGVQRWTRLVATREPSAGSIPGTAPIEAPVEDVRLVDRDHDLAFLHAPGLPPCDVSGAGPGIDGGRDVSTARALPPGTILSGVRDRHGYRTREFRATVERRLHGPGGAEILIARLMDPGGAESGLLFDAAGDLAAVILPPPADGDPDRIAAVRYAIGVDTPAGTAVPLRDALSGAAAAGAPPVRLFAQAILIDRDDQADRALRLLEQTARMAGEFDDLVLERGLRRFRLGRTEMAIEDFSRLASRAPGLHAAHYNLGVALGAAGRYADAIEAFRAAASIDPAHPGTRFQLALAQAALGHPGAREQYEALRGLDDRMATELKAILAF